MKVEEKEIVKGLYMHKNPKNKFLCLSLYWFAHPERDEKWKNDMISALGKEEFSREYELDFSQEKGKKVYPEFSEKNIVKLKPIPELPLIIGWDFGYHHPAIVILQKPEKDRIIVLNEFMGTDILLQDFVKEFIEFKEKVYPDYTMRHFCDPAGRFKKDTDAKTSADILRKFKIYPYAKKHRVVEGISIVRHLIKNTGSDGYRNLLVDPNCKILIEGFMGGYVFPETSAGFKEVPANDGYYEHLQDALRYAVVGVMKGSLKIS